MWHINMLTMCHSLIELLFSSFAVQTRTLILNVYYRMLTFLMSIMMTLPFQKLLAEIWNLFSNDLIHWRKSLRIGIFYHSILVVLFAFTVLLAKFTSISLMFACDGVVKIPKILRILKSIKSRCGLQWLTLAVYLWAFA